MRLAVEVLMVCLFRTLLTIVCFGHLAFAAESSFVDPGPLVEKIEKVSGIELSNVYQMVQDSSGFLWLASPQGLLRYDGYEIKQYRHDSELANTLSNDLVIDIVQDSEGILWLSTVGGGLNRFDPSIGAFQHFRHALNNPDSLSSDSLFDFAVSHSGKIWIGSRKGLNLFDPQTGINVRYDQRMAVIRDAKAVANLLDTWTVFEDSNHYLWYSVYGHGVYRYSLNSGQLEHYLHDEDNPNSLDANVVSQIFEDSQGRIWVATSDGVNLFDPATTDFKHYSMPLKAANTSQTTEVRRIFEDVDGRLWVGVRFNGLSVYDKHQDAFVEVNQGASLKDTLNAFSVYDIIQDNSGALWFSTEYNGLIKLNPDAFAFNHRIGRAVGELDIHSLYRHHDGTVYIAANANLYRFDEDTAQFTLLLENIGFIAAMAHWSETSMLLGISDGGIFEYHIATNQLLPFGSRKGSVPQLPSNAIQTIATTDDGQLWVGLFRIGAEYPFGLYSFDPQQMQFKAQLANHTIESILPLKDGRLLVATRHNGSLLLDIQTGQTDYLLPRDSVSNEARVLFRDSAERIWLGTFGAGLALVDVTTKTLQFYNSKQGLPDADIRSIHEASNGQLWIGSQSVLFSFDPQIALNPEQTKTAVGRSFDQTDGMRLNNFDFRKATMTKAGQLMFANRSELVWFSPEQLSALSLPPAKAKPVLLTDFKLFNKPVPLQYNDPASVLPVDIDKLPALILSYQDSLFSIGFASQNYRQLGKIKYAYQLLGFEDRWIETDSDNRVATFTSLPAKDYLFRVKASNADGSWNEQISTLAITVTPPFWRTSIAYLLYLISIVGGLYGFYRYRTQSLIRRANALELGVKERTATINTLLAQKERMFANVSHEFRTPLTLILSPIETLLSAKTLDTPQSKSTLAMMKRNAQRLLRMVEQLLELSRLEANTQQVYKNYSLKANLDVLITSFQPLLDSKQIELSCDNYADIVLSLKPDSLEMILVNLLSNAIKYTKNGGKVSVHVTTEDNFAKISITDTGIGISPENQSIVFNRFTRANEQHDENIPGAGIGLALVKELVESNKGQLSLVSEPGVGSTFTIYLPLATDIELQVDKSLLHDLSLSSKTEIDSLLEAVQQPQHLLPQDSQHQSAPDASATDETDSSERPQLLLIDDSADMLQMLQQTLAPDFSCQVAHQGEMGIALALENLPDLIVCDVMMPGISGFEVAERLRHNELTCHIPLVLLTAKTDIESRMKGWQQDVDDYLTKPFHPDELVARIKSLLSIRSLLKHRFAAELSLRHKAVEQSQQPQPRILDQPQPQPQPQEQQQPPTNPVAAKPTFVGMNDKDKKLVEKFEQVISDHYHDPRFNRLEAAKHMAMSDRQLHRKLDALFDQNFSEYLRKYRLQKSLELFKTGMQITQIADQIGFSSISYFAKCFNAEYGMPPKQYQKELLGG